jgi:hypothetical protein
MARLGRVLSAAIMVGTAFMPASVDAQSSSKTLQARATAAGSPKSAPLAPSPRVSAGSIRGVVSDERGGPVRGALVSAIGATMASAVTDQSGRFAIDALPAGDYVVRAHLTGFVASKRESVRVGSSIVVAPQLQVRRLAPVVGTSGEKTLPSRPIVAAGFLPQPDRQDSDSADGAAKDGHSHSDLAWRLRHLKRSILKNESGAVIASAEEPEIPQSSILGRAFDSAAGIAAALFSDVPFTGEVNLLTSSAFGPGELFGGQGPPRGIAYLAIGSPTPAGEWTVRAAMSEGDLASWVIAGSFASRAGESHAYNVGLSYATQDYQGGNPAALAAIRDGGRNAGEVFGFDRYSVKPWLTLDYGARVARYGYLEQPRALLSPRLGVTVEPYKGTRISTLVVQHMVAPGAEEFLPRAITGPALPPERTFAPIPGTEMRAERARLIEVQLEREFEGAYVIGVRRFHQNVDDQLVTLFRVSPPGEQESVGHYYVANVGNFDANGWSFRVSSPATARVRGSVDYAFARATWTSRNADIGELIPSVMRPESEHIHDITTSVHTDIPETATRFYVVYRINNAFSRADNPNPGIDGRFDLQVNQALPFGVAGTKWEVLVGMRNLFRDPISPSSVYDELLVVRPPKRVVGGFLVRF